MISFRIRSWARAERGSMTSLFGFGILVVVGFSMLTVDLGYHQSLKNELQTAADTAAMAAATQLPATVGPVPLPVKLVARANVAKNLNKVDAGNPNNLPYRTSTHLLPDSNIVMGSWDSATKTFSPNTAPINALQVEVQMTQAAGNPAPTFFGKVFGRDSADVRAAAIAARPPSPNCMVALEPTGQALTVNSGSEVTATDCALHINSSDSSAVELNSGSEINADGLDVVGGYVQPGGTFINLPPGETVNTGAAPLADPFAGLAAPPEASNPCDETNNWSPPTTPYTTPGPMVFCKGVTVQNGEILTLSPGTYVIKGDKFLVNSGGVVYGTDVTIYLVDTDAKIDFNSGSHVEISAPTTGDYAGMLIFQNPAVPPTNDHFFNSDTTSLLNGVVYLPSGFFQVNSATTVQAGTANPDFLYVIAHKYDINSGSRLKLKAPTNFSSWGVPKALRTYSSLVR